MRRRLSMLPFLLACSAMGSGISEPSPIMARFDPDAPPPPRRARGGTVGVSGGGGVVSPRSFDCPTCLAPPMVECRRTIFGRILTRAEKALYIGNNADGCAILNQPAGIVHIERANMANRAERAATGKTDPDWNVGNLYAEKPEPEPERRATGKQTTIIGERE